MCENSDTPSKIDYKSNLKRYSWSVTITKCGVRYIEPGKLSRYTILYKCMCSILCALHHILYNTKVAISMKQKEIHII